MPHVGMTCRFRLGSVVGDMPFVDRRLAERAIVAVHGSVEVKVTFTDTQSASEYSSGDVMWCLGFDLVASADVLNDAGIDEVFNVVVDVATAVADTVWVSYPNGGPAGTDPLMEEFSLLVDGQPVDYMRGTQFGHRAIVVGWEPATRESIESAVRGDSRPNLPRILLAQADHYARGNPRGSKSAALTLAATACELAVKSLLVECCVPVTAKLVNALIPARSQSKLSPPELLTSVLPVSLGHTLTKDDSELIRKYRALYTARNELSHAGHVPDDAMVVLHVNTTRSLLTWIEHRRSDRTVLSEPT